MNNKELMDASCRVALAAMLHDLGKFAERANIHVDQDVLDAHKTIYCPWNSTGKGHDGYHSHVHAAYTAIAFDVIEKHVPDLIKGNVYPFVSRRELQNNFTSTEIDSLINAAASHHNPKTTLQWIIATADRVASGFERERFVEYNRARDENPDTDTGRNHYQARMLSLFEEVSLFKEQPRLSRHKLKWRYPLEAFSPKSIFPQPRLECEPSEDHVAKKQYAQLWQEFLSGLEKIPITHRQSWPLWLDHFDTAWMTFTHAIPSATAFGTRPDVSLYDHSKTTAALAVALWRWHLDQNRLSTSDAELLKTRKDWDDKKILLIQGDFFGIQEFIFADGSQTRRNAVRLLRGRSFQVSLFTELAALKILETLCLPSTSQIINAAGKFLIVAPNTSGVLKALESLQKEFNQWFLEHSFGLAGIGIVARAASCNDFLETEPENRFSTLMKSLFQDLDRAKLHRFNLLDGAPTVFNVHYPHGVCRYNNKLPNDQCEADSGESAALSRDQIEIGKGLANKERMLIVRDREALKKFGLVKLELPIFDYHVAFTAAEEDTGRFGNLVQEGTLSRFWDFSLPKHLDQIPWHGYARRYVNAYVPRFSQEDLLFDFKYFGSEKEQFEQDRTAGELKTFWHLACEDRKLLSSTEQSPKDWIGQVALLTAKGDVDNLGLIFQKGLKAPTFTKMSALSRMVNAFFAVYLPALCAQKFQNTYTVFAGGDDFFVLGPWLSTQRLLTHMRKDFNHFVAENPDITFSIGTIMTKPNVPIHMLTLSAEDALDQAKTGVENNVQKNAIVLYGERISWEKWDCLERADAALNQLIQDYNISNSYLYSLLCLTDLASNETHPEHFMWRSRLSYRTYRMIVEGNNNKDKNQHISIQKEFIINIVKKGIIPLQSRYKIPLFNHFYQLRG